MFRLFCGLLALAFAEGWAAPCADIRALYTPAYDRCVQNAQSTADALACLDAEYRRQDEKLNAAYREARQRLQPFRRDTLRDVQRAWMAYRDAKCRFYRHKESGSGGALDAVQCLVDTTILRTVELRLDTY